MANPDGYQTKGLGERQKGIVVKTKGIAKIRLRVRRVGGEQTQSMIAGGHLHKYRNGKKRERCTVPLSAVRKTESARGRDAKAALAKGLRVLVTVISTSHPSSVKKCISRQV